MKTATLLTFFACGSALSVYALPTATTAKDPSHTKSPPPTEHSPTPEDILALVKAAEQHAKASPKPSHHASSASSASSTSTQAPVPTSGTYADASDPSGGSTNLDNLINAEHNEDPNWH